MKTIKISSPAFSSEIFQVVKLSGRESVNELFQYQILLKTPDLDQVSFVQQFGSNSPAASVDLTAWIGQSVNVGIELDGKEIGFSEVHNTIRQHYKKTVGQGIRYLDGIITNADYLYDQGRSSYYCLSIRPFVYPATLNQNHRIFQDKTVIEILDEVLSAYPGTVEKRLEEQKAERYTKRDYQTQFGESDFRFFARLCAEWGINYWFEHGSDGHTLILSDEPQNHKAMPSEAYHRVAYYPQGHKINEEYLHEFNVLTRMVSGAFASADYDYAQASSTIQNHRHNSQPYPEAQKQGKTTGKVSEQIASQEVFDYAADVVQPEAGPHQQGNHSGDEQVLRDLWNLARLQQTHLTAVASGNIRGIVTGHQFNLEKHPSALANINWAVKSTELLIMDLAEESQRKEGGFSSLLTDRNNLSQALTDKVIKKFDALLNNSNQKWQIECTAELIPANVPIRPEHIEKPRGGITECLGGRGGGCRQYLYRPFWQD